MTPELGAAGEWAAGEDRLGPPWTGRAGDGPWERRAPQGRLRGAHTYPQVVKPAVPHVVGRVEEPRVLSLRPPAASPLGSETPCPTPADKAGGHLCLVRGGSGQGLLWGRMAKSPPVPGAITAASAREVGRRKWLACTLSTQ